MMWFFLAMLACEPADETQPDALQQELQDKASTLFSCYQQRLMMVGPSFEGQWRVDLVVRADGTADEISVQAEGTPDVFMEGCIAKRAWEWTFTPPPADQTVAHTFTFAPKH